MTTLPLFGFGAKPISVGWSKTLTLDVEIGTVDVNFIPPAGIVTGLPFSDSKFSMNDDPNITKQKKIYDKTEKVTYLKTTSKHGRGQNGDDGLSIKASYLAYLPQIASEEHSDSIEFTITCPSPTSAPTTYWEAWRDWAFPNFADPVAGPYEGYGQVSDPTARALWQFYLVPWIDALNPVYGNASILLIPNPVAFPSQQDAQNFINSVKYGLSSDTSTYGIQGPIAGPPDIPIYFFAITATTLSGKNQKFQVIDRWFSLNTGGDSGTYTIAVDVGTLEITSSFSGGGWEER